MQDFFLSPKQKHAIRQEQKARRETEDHEYVYNNRALCGILGSLSIMGSFVCTSISTPALIALFSWFSS